VINLERALKKRSKELIQKMKQRRFKATTLKKALEKSPILQNGINKNLIAL
jgi:hypothetical protein